MVAAAVVELQVPRMAGEKAGGEEVTWWAVVLMQEEAEGGEGGMK